ncbi:hypothetical protein [Bacillus weihaiensis]|uniref:hypothetical protein n=1 Tax=Bacillus weihaiensis TaxID=1547283 RepID=UPI0023526508|nr:hypothetical protein [Bacillus weihaiensis]
MLNLTQLLADLTWHGSYGIRYRSNRFTRSLMDGIRQAYINHSSKFVLNKFTEA